jgi:hypothetical protein
MVLYVCIQKNFKSVLCQGSELRFQKHFASVNLNCTVIPCVEQKFGFCTVNLKRCLNLNMPTKEKITK